MTEHTKSHVPMNFFCLNLIGAVCVAGKQIPPYFVFPGSRMKDCLLDSKTPVLMVTCQVAGQTVLSLKNAYNPIS